MDDLVVAGAGVYFEKQVKQLRDSFPFGSWDCAQDKSVKLCGCDVFLTADFDIWLNQERFALSIDEINLERSRKDMPQ